MQLFFFSDARRRTIQHAFVFFYYYYLIDKDSENMHVTQMLHKNVSFDVVSV